jgi:hypothetical protein
MPSNKPAASINEGSQAFVLQAMCRLACQRRACWVRTPDGALALQLVTGETLVIGVDGVTLATHPDNLGSIRSTHRCR